MTRGYHFKVFSLCILNVFHLVLPFLSLCAIFVIVGLIVTVSRETLWTCIGSCEKLFLLCFSSEVLGLEGAPAWVRSRWRSVGLLNAKWIMWHVGAKRLKSSDVFAADGDSAQDGSDFNWDDYLEETGALSVPHHAFKHVGAGSKSSAAIRNKWLWHSC